MTGKNALVMGLKLVGLTVVLFLLFGLGSQLFLPRVESLEPSQEELANLMTVFLGFCFLQTVAVSYPVIRSRWAGWKLIATIFVVFYGTATVTGQLESVVYLGNRLPQSMLSGLFLMGAFSAAVFSPIVVLAWGKWRRRSAVEQENGRRGIPLRQLLWKSAVAAGVYLILYYTFGYFIAWKNPALREYYGGTDPGNFFAQMRMVAQGTPWMLPFQFLRGLLWTGLGLLVIRMMKGAWWEAGLALALLFAVPSVSLLLPNALMPETVRMTHFVETLPYQFFFGWFLAWLFLPRRAPIG